MERDPRAGPSPAPRSQDLVVGVDGGGTGSRALLLDPKGREVGSAEGPPAVVSASDPEAAAEAIAGTIRNVMDQAGISPPLAALWTGLAGAGRSGAREAVEIALRSRGFARETRVGMDVEGAHWDAFQGEPGVLLSVGTGTVVWGRDVEGKEIKVGGWGHPLGEEGSGYWFGLEGLKGVVRAADGRGPTTVLTSALLGALELSEPPELVPWIETAAKGEIGALAPMVLQAASQGDAVAGALLHEGTAALKRHLDVVERVWLPSGAPFPLALAGGLLQEDSPLRAPVLDMALGLGADVRLQDVVAVRGAAWLALRLLDSNRIPSSA